MKPDTQLATLNKALSTRHAELVILCDVSDSMQDCIKKGSPKTRMQAMHETLLGISDKLLGGVIIYKFGLNSKRASTFEEIQNYWDTDSGGTDIVQALQTAAKHQPGHIILLTDGHDTEHENTKVIGQARSIFSKIDVYFCGNHSEKKATDCAHALSQYGGATIIDPTGANMLNSITLFLQ
jgi:hypothetical protein